MPRVDIAATIAQVTFPDDVWQWLDVLGDVIAASQVEALRHEDFLADTEYKKLLVRALNRDLSSYMAVYVLLRAELIHQAAAQVRLAGEALITLRYIARDPDTRVSLFLKYARVESYELVESMLAFERSRARKAHVERGERVLASLVEDYHSVKSSYTFRNKRGEERPYRNWCNVTLADQARECGGELPRLYKLVYSQLSAYVHGSGWSLRRQYSYSRKHYDGRIVLADIATMVRTTILVWLEWARFCEEQLGWEFGTSPHIFASRIDTLDASTFPDGSDAA